MSDVDRKLREMHREFVDNLGEVLDLEAGLAEVLGIPPGFPSWYVPERPALPTGPLGRAQRQLAELLAHPVIQEVMSQSVLDEKPARTGAYLRAGTLVIDGVPQPPPQLGVAWPNASGEIRIGRRPGAPISLCIDSTSITITDEHGATFEARDLEIRAGDVVGVQRIGGGDWFAYITRDETEQRRVRMREAGESAT
jgi:hypothetical protein